MRSTPPCPEKETRIASFGRVTLYRQLKADIRLAHGRESWLGEEPPRAYTQRRKSGLESSCWLSPQKIV